jgi:hypothetical protein
MEGTRRATARAVKVKEYSIRRGCVNVRAGTPFFPSDDRPADSTDRALNEVSFKMHQILYDKSCVS